MILSVHFLSDGGIETVDLNLEDAENLCISSENCILLSTIGVQLEMMFGNPRDIEWAISEVETSAIYILQC